MNTETNEKLTDEIYQYLLPFLREPAELRPILGNVFMRDGRCYAADGYVMFDFPLSVIQIEDWLFEHCRHWDELANGKATDAFMQWDDDIDDLVADLSKIDNLLPCGMELVATRKEGYPNPDQVTNRFTWESIGNISATALWTLCYRQRQRWAGKDWSCVNIPNTHVNVLVSNLEKALKFPLLLQGGDDLLLSLGTGNNDDGHAIKLSNNDSHVLIMNFLGSDNPD